MHGDSSTPQSEDEGWFGDAAKTVRIKQQADAISIAAANALAAECRADRAEARADELRAELIQFQSDASGREQLFRSLIDQMSSSQARILEQDEKAKETMRKTLDEKSDAEDRPARAKEQL